MKLSIVLFALASQTQAMRLCNFFCPMILDEVCGSDGNTYGKILTRAVLLRAEFQLYETFCYR